MKSGLIVLGVIFILYFLFFNNSSSPVVSTNGYEDYDSGSCDDYCNDKISEYQSALEEANNNIEEANYMIEDAKSYAWETYEEMGEALDSLETVNTVSEPY